MKVFALLLAFIVHLYVGTFVDHYQWKLVFSLPIARKIFRFSIFTSTHISSTLHFARLYLIQYCILFEIYNHYLSSVEAKCNLNIGLVEIYFVTKNFLLAVCVQEISPYGGQEQCAREEYTCDWLETNGLQSFKVYYDKLTTVLPIVKK